MTEQRISREQLQEIMSWANHPTVWPGPATVKLLHRLAKALLAQDDALKPFYDSGWLATLCALESVPDDVAVILSFKKEGMGGATSEIKVGDFRKARAARLPSEEVK